MNPKTLIVYKSQILFEILDEIKEYLNLKIISANDEDLKNINLEILDNYVIISTKEQKNFENFLFINSLPKKFRIF